MSKKSDPDPQFCPKNWVEIGCLLFQFERELCVGKVSRALPLGGEIITLSALDFDADNIISYR
jgi:hypothetical protein